MIHFTHTELENLIFGDSGWGDLTSNLVPYNGKASLKIITRSEIIASNLDTVMQICEMKKCDFKSEFYNSQKVAKGEILAHIKGDFKILHEIYKVIQTLLEYACGIATNTHEMVTKAKSINPKCEILLTRKNFPFAKKLCLKSALDGGGLIHRLGTYDSILFFENHLVGFKNLDEFLAKINEFKAKFCEKKIIVEVSEVDFAKELLKLGVSGIQCDKMSIDNLKEIVKFRDENLINSIILAAGGINAQNADSYAFCDSIVTSAPYRGVADLGAKISIN